MENFFIEENFYSDLDDLINGFDWIEEDVHQLPDNWSVEVQDSTLEKIFKIDKSDVNDWVEDRLYSRHDDRFPEEPDRMIEKIEKAILSGMDLEKINEAMPSLYYPNDKKYTITKADLVEYIK